MTVCGSLGDGGEGNFSRGVPGTTYLKRFSREVTGCSQQAKRSEYPTQQQARHTNANLSKRPHYQWLASAPKPGHERVSYDAGGEGGIALKVQPGVCRARSLKAPWPPSGNDITTPAAVYFLSP